MWQNLRARGGPDSYPREWWEVPIQCGGAFGGQGGNVFAIINGQDKEEVQKLAGIVVDAINDKFKPKEQPTGWVHRLSMVAACFVTFGMLIWVTVLPFVGLLYLFGWVK